MKNNKKWIALLWITLSATAFGCNWLSHSENTIADKSTTDETEYPVNNGIDLGVTSQWPMYLPDEIPILAGEIRLVMGSPENKVRIFYESLTESQIEQYVELCRARGFEITYLVFTREGFADFSDEKLKAGDYDAIEMIKGQYWMRLEFGSETATLDINIPSTTDQVQTTNVPLLWPEDISTNIPQPDHCKVRNISNLSDGGYQIICEYTDGNIRVDEYLQVLKSLGFQETDHLINDENKFVYLIFEKEAYSVKLNLQAFASTITFQIVPVE